VRTIENAIARFARILERAGAEATDRLCLSLSCRSAPIAPQHSVRIFSNMKHGRRCRRSNLKRKETVMSRKDNGKVESYVESEEEREKGHVDTRHKNFECENKTSIGCDPGIDVAG
jgi:hypothetical protein